MHSKMVILLASLALGTVWAKSQQNPTVSQPVKEVHIEADSMDIALQRLAKQYRLIVGMDNSRTRGPSPVRAHVADGSLKDVLDALVAGSPDYSWRTEGSGAVHFYDNEVSQRLSRAEAWDSIRRLPEVKQWTKKADCPERTAYVLTGGSAPRPEDENITVQMSNVSLRKILDELALQSGDYFWVVDRYESNGRCFTSISF